MKLNGDRFLLCARILPWILGAVLLVGFILTRWPPSGVRTLAFVFDGRSPWFDAFLPAERVMSPKTWEEGWTGQRILMDPVYASLRAPGSYDGVRILLEMRFWKQPLVELGMLRDPNTFSFEMLPVWSESLSRGWREVMYGARHGYVREDLPDQTIVTADSDHVLVWHATTTPLQAMDHAGPTKTYEISLRGGHEFYVIPVDGRLDMTLAFQDMNRHAGENTIALRVSQESETVWTKTLQTGGAQDREATAVFETPIHVGQLKPGVYRVSLVMGDDIFLRRITTNAVHWVVGPRVYLGDTVGYAKKYLSVPMWTNSQHMVLETFHQEGLQPVRLGMSEAEVEQTHRAYSLDRSPGEREGAREVTVPRGDLRIVGDAFFSFSPQALFLPSPRRLTDASDPLGEGVQAVITPYIRPIATRDGWWRVAVDMRLHPNDERPKLSISAPGVRSREGWVDIRFAELTYHRSIASFRVWVRGILHDLKVAWKERSPL